MKTTGKDTTKDTKVQDAGCGSGCACTSGGSPRRVRVIIGILVIGITTVLVAWAIIKSNQTEPQTPSATFTASGIAQPLGAESGPAAQETDVSRPTESVVTEIDTLADLNTMAAATDAVFVFLPGIGGEPPVAQMKSAAATIGARGSSVGIFMLKKTAPEYKSIAVQVPVPCVLAMVKGRSAAPVTGEITETKLVQGFVTASSAGSCGPSGCGPVDCN